MSSQASSDDPHPAAPQPALLRPLLQPGEPTSAAALVESYGLRARQRAPARPYVVLNMVSTVDGRASVSGRSGPLGNPADRELFHALRASVDGVLVGAGTVRTERYGRIIRDEARRRERVALGLTAEPLACIVTAGLSLPADIPLLAEPEAHVVIVTTSRESLGERAARVDYVRAERGGRLDLSAALAELHERFSIDTLLCEGGPHLNGELLTQELVDELHLSLSPKLAGGDDDAGALLRIVEGPELQPLVAMTLLGAAESQSLLFLRYGV